MQVLFQFKSIIWLISSISLKHFKYDVKHFLTKKQWQSTIVYLLISTMTTFMLAWNWKLICAILIGIILMIFIQKAQNKSFQNIVLNWYKFLNSPKGKLALAVVSGCFGIMGSYITLSALPNIGNYWLASELIFQDLGIFIILIILVPQLFDLLEKKQNIQYKELISQLSELNPLKRLIAVQDVSQLLEKKQLNINQEKEVLEYFKFMLNQEQEIVILQNILKNLF